MWFASDVISGIKIKRRLSTSNLSFSSTCSVAGSEPFRLDWTGFKDRSILGGVV